MANKIKDDSDDSQNVVNWEKAELREMRESHKMFVDYAKSLPADGSRRTVSNFIRLRRVKLDCRGYDVSLEYNLRVTKPHLYKWERNGAHGFIEAYDRPDAIYSLSLMFPDCWFRL
jgi:hypothetical protein